MLLLSCANPYPTHYSIGVVGFAPEQTRIIVSAIHKWEDAVGDPSMLSVSIHVDGCDANGEGDTCIIPHRLETSYIAQACSGGSDALGCTASAHGVGADDSFPVIVLFDDAIVGQGDRIFGSNDVLFGQVVQHELGHAFGLRHEASKVVMNAYATHASPDVTCDDVAQLYSLHGKTMSCP